MGSNFDVNMYFIEHSQVKLEFRIDSQLTLGLNLNRQMVKLHFLSWKSL